LDHLIADHEVIPRFKTAGSIYLVGPLLRGPYQNPGLNSKERAKDKYTYISLSLLETKLESYPLSICTSFVQYFKNKLMKNYPIFVLLALTTSGSLCFSQSDQTTIIEDFKPSTLMAYLAQVVVSIRTVIIQIEFTFIFIPVLKISIL
jgi:hypothetical protein